MTDFSMSGMMARAGGSRLQAYAARSRAETAGSLPDSLFLAAPRTNFTPGDFDDLNAQQISASAYSPIGAGDASLTLYTRRSAAERFNVNQAPDPNVRGLTVNSSLGGTADWRRTATLGAGTLAFRFGLDGAVHSVRVRIYNEPQTPTVPPAVDHDDVTSSGLTTDVRSPSLNLAGYALTEYHLRRLTLSAGARDDYIQTPFRNVVDPINDTTSSYHHLSLRGGVTLSLAHGASVYASVSGGFRAPAILELGCADPSDACPLPFALGDDPPLKPVTATRSVARESGSSASAEPARRP
jgi:outer membrane receptor protein involved in Fe transport